MSMSNEGPVDADAGVDRSSSQVSEGTGAGVQVIHASGRRQIDLYGDDVDADGTQILLGIAELVIFRSDHQVVTVLCELSGQFKADSAGCARHQGRLLLSGHTAASTLGCKDNSPKVDRRNPPLRPVQAEARVWDAPVLASSIARTMRTPTRR
jgi:hypothetical protein